MVRKNWRNWSCHEKTHLRDEQLAGFYVLKLKINELSWPPTYCRTYSHIAKPNADLLLFRLQFHRQNSFDDLNGFTGLLNALLQLHMHETSQRYCTPAGVDQFTLCIVVRRGESATVLRPVRIVATQLVLSIFRILNCYSSVKSRSVLSRSYERAILIPLLHRCVCNQVSIGCVKKGIRL